MRVGLLGGSFDPPHVGHLLMAQDAADHLALDRVVWMPTATQPHKADRAPAPAVHRLAMVERATAGDSRFVTSEAEVARGGLSFTVETLRTEVAREGGHHWFLLVGADAFAGFARWREPEAIARLATVAVLARAGERPGAQALAAVAGAIEVPVRRVDVSSTEVRARVRAGRSIKGFVTESVAAYVAEHGLYR